MYRGWHIEIRGETSVKVTVPGTSLLMDWTCKATKDGKYLVTKNTGLSCEKSRDRILRTIDANEGPVPHETT